MQAVIFDLDGTLLDTAHDLSAAVNFALSTMDFPAHSTKAIVDMVGQGVSVLLEQAVPRALTSAEKTQLEASFMDYYLEHMGETCTAYPGMQELVRDLRERGISLAVVSNKPDVATKELVERYFSGMFSVVMGKSDDFPRKPNPASTCAALKRLGASASEAVYVGDSDTDVQTAQAAHVPFIGVTWGFRSAEHLRSAGATKLALDANELQNYLQ